VGKRRRNSNLNIALFLLLAACSDAKHPLLEDLSHHEDLGFMHLGNARGTRDGDRLSAQLLITDSSNVLTLDLHFQVTPPTRLESGVWKFSRGTSGRVEAKSITFLGGQSDGPSLGGTFDLLDPQGRALYRVHLPTTPLKKQL
jgi:hypothetical protein